MTSLRAWLLPQQTEGPAPAAAPPADFLLDETDGRPTFAGCERLAGVRVTLPRPTPVRSVEAWFLGLSESETWNSWLRAPRLPPVGSLALRLDGEAVACSERRSLAATAVEAAVGTATRVTLGCDAREASELELRFPPGRWALWRVRVTDSPPVPDGPWPPLPYAGPAGPVQLPPAAGDALAEALRQQAAGRGASDGEPTLDDVWQLARPYRGGALLGLPEGPLAYQLWDGSLVVRPAGVADRLLLTLECDGQRLWASGGTWEGALRGGHLPIGEVTLESATLSLGEVALVDAMGQLRIGLRLHNRSPAPLTVRLRAAQARREPSLDDPKLQAEVQRPLGLIASAAGTEQRLQLAPERADAVAWSVAAGATVEASLRLPLSAPTSDGTSLESAAAAVAAEAAAFLGAGATLDLPDAQLTKLWQALLLHNRLFIRDGIMRYGLFPGLYEDGLFGVEEGWNIVALAEYGHRALAATTLERTFFSAEFLRKDGPHHQYRNGLALTYALDVYNLTGDEALLRRLWPTVEDSARWIEAAFASTRVLESGQRPPHHGLMPRHIYGGDLRTPAYSLYASSACWRGLRDAGRIAARLGETERATALQRAAQEVRADIVAAAERIYRRPEGQPPFLPFRTDETADQPSSGDYYQLFASLVLETAVFGFRGPLARRLSDYLFETGREVLGVPRFDVWFGRLGVDAEYARGAQLARLARGELDRFYVGVLGQLGLSCDRRTFVSPETALVRFTAAEEAERLLTLATQAARADSDPCSAGTGVMLQYLRRLLVYEERDEDDLPTGLVQLGAAAPAAWFRPGQSFAVRRLPTLCGELSYRCSSEAEWVVYDISCQSPVETELFYRDRQGHRQSSRRRIEGQKQVALRRA